MADALAIVLAQLNPTVGDLDGNAAALLKVWREAADARADLVVAPELFVSGYPPEDLVKRPGFQGAVAACIEQLADATRGSTTAMLVGAPWRDGDALHNSVLLLADGGVAAVRHKCDLPNYGVFDEKRVFAPGGVPDPIPFRGVSLGVMICEDVWSASTATALRRAGADLLIVINASPFETDKSSRRMAVATARVRETGLPLMYVNLVGGQDELVFDGESFVLSAKGETVLRLPSWQTATAVSRWERAKAGWRCASEPLAPLSVGPEAIYQALTVGLRDYVTKNGFRGVVLGLSGGIDSAISAAVAVDALGAANVHCVMLPSEFTSERSIVDATACAQVLGTRLETISIKPAVEAFRAMLRPSFSGQNADTTEENVQARARAVTLMALSNKFGYLLLTTGNKSEMSVGYATLYGDMSGGFSVLKDVYKTTVYELSAWRNAHLPEGARGPAGVVIPDGVITRAPTAELKPNQTDQDTLPPYPQLDDILRGLVEDELTVAEIAARGHALALVVEVEGMLYRAEYKRRQAPPGVRITRRNFGRDRRYPITNKFREGLKAPGKGTNNGKR